MTIALTGAGGFFTRIGRFGKLAHDTRTYQGTLATDFESLMAQYATLRYVVDGAPTIDRKSRLADIGFMESIRPMAQRTLIEMVKADKPTAAGSIADAMAELIRQMKASVDSVKTCTVSTSTAALTGSSGTGVIVSTAKRGDGLSQELIIPELAYIQCSGDAQTGGTTQGQETFTYTGEVATASVWSDDYPIGSGVSTDLTAVDATVDASTSTNFGNMLVNSDFEAFTANVPDSWAVISGTPGTHFQQGATAYTGTKSLQFIGSAGTPNLAQSFDDSTNSPATALPDTSYAIAVWMKADVVPAAGVLKIDLVDSTNTVVNDDQGVANTITINLNGLTTSFVAQTGVFRTPKLIPSILKIRVRISTALSVGSNVFFDHLSMGRVTGLYAGGPGVCVHSGATPFAFGDGWTLTAAQDYGGASNLSTWQWLMDRLFGMRALGLLLPSNGAPTIADTLIST